MEEIHKIEFNNKTSDNLGFEIVRLEELLGTDLLISKLGIVHQLTFYAIMFIADGNNTHCIDFKNHRYKKGSLIFIADDQVHAFSTEKDYRGFLVLFTSEFLMKNLSPTEIRSFSSIYNYEIYNPVSQVSKEFYTEFLRLFQDLETEYQQHEDHLSENILRNQLKVLLLKMERHRAIDQKIVSSKYYAEFIQLQALLKANIKTEYRVQFYADKLFMSAKKLNTITHEILGLSAKKVISSIRVLKMKRSLMNLPQSIKEVAFEFGFDEQTNFVKFFKKQTGVTPSDFRALNQ